MSFNGYKLAYMLISQLDTCNIVVSNDNRRVLFKNCVIPRRIQIILLLTKRLVSQVVPEMTSHCIIGTHSITLNVVTTDICRSCAYDKDFLCVDPKFSQTCLVTDVSLQDIVKQQSIAYLNYGF